MLNGFFHLNALNFGFCSGKARVLIKQTISAYWKHLKWIPLKCFWKMDPSLSRHLIMRWQHLPLKSGARQSDQKRKHKQECHGYNAGIITQIEPSYSEWILKGKL